MTPTLRSELAPNGKLRAGINFGNTVLVNKGRDGLARGIAVDLAAEIARRTGVHVDFVTYDTAGHMADGARKGAWDVAFLATDPARSDQITFTEPYLEIDTTYLVAAGSPLEIIEDVDREGIRIAVSAKSAYDLFLTRSLKHAELVRASSPEASAELFFTGKLDALAGIRPMLVDVSRNHTGTRLLDGRFTVVRQAIGIPRGRDAAAAFLRVFVQEIKASGFLPDILDRNGIAGVSIAP